MSGDADILLKGGYVIDPAQGIDGLADVALRTVRLLLSAPMQEEPRRR